MELEDNSITLEVVYIARRLLVSACTRSGASEGRKKWNGSSAPGGVMGPRRGSPVGRSGGPPQGNFLNLDCKSLILSTSRGDTNYQQTEYFYGF